MEPALGGLIHPEMTGLIGLIFALGLRHGFDPDHLVAIDGMTRSSARVRPGMSRWSGLFFSLGHGAVVTLVGLGVALAAADLRAPRWLEQLGAGISIGVLLVLGIGNLLMTARTPSGTAVPLVGMRGRWLADRLARASHPLVIASVGAAFALSFDTLSHALLFSLTGASMAGALFGAMLGIGFTLGLVSTDTLSGWGVGTAGGGDDRLSAGANAIRLLTSFSGEEDELGITTLAGRLRLAKSTVHRLAATLTGAGFLEQNGETGKYRLGVALFELGALVRRRMDVANEARPKLRELLEKTGETVQLGIVDHFSVLYVYEMESRRAIRMAAAVGGRAPLHCTAVGKVLLAHQPGDFVKEAIGRGLTAYTPKTITKREAVLAMLDEVRLRRHAIDDEESEGGLRAIAAPVRNHNGAVIAALGVAAPVQRMNKKLMQTCVPSVIETADAVSARLGYLPSRSRADF